MNRWDIYWADVPYEEDPSIRKKRPVIIAKDQSPVYVLTLKVTSKEARAEDPGDYPLTYWKEAGLSAPSVVRILKISRLAPEAFGDCIGRVQAADAYAIQEKMNDLRKNRKK